MCMYIYIYIYIYIHADQSALARRSGLIIRRFPCLGVRLRSAAKRVESSGTATVEARLDPRRAGQLAAVCVPG